MQRKTMGQNRFVTLMVIPEKTRSVHKIVVPFFLIKLGAVLLSLACIFGVLVSVDYVHVLGNLAENKRLKGENFKLRQEVQNIQNKVENMETTIERVSNYARKLQLLTGQGKGAVEELPRGGGPDEIELEEHGMHREPSSYRLPPARPTLNPASLDEKIGDRIEKLQSVTQKAELILSQIQVSLLNQRAILSATPSLFPVAGWISSSFGRRHHPFDGTIKLHTGVDIAADSGSPVRAPADGVILFSGYKEGYGKVIVINHGYNISTLVAHNSELFLHAGERVKRGDVIASVGSTGHSTGAHVHFEIRKNGIPVNPESFLVRNRY